MKIDVRLHADELRLALRDDVQRGLTASPKQLPPKWFYDDRGSKLFDEITRLDEYYPTRREREILAANARDIATAAAPDTLVELGSGTSEKTRILIRALRDGGSLRRFVPFDVSEPTLRDAAGAIETEFAGLDVHAVVGDFERHLDTIPRDGRRLIALLGGTIGNLAPEERAGFLKEISALMGDHDSFLVGLDLVKDPSRLVRAYDDARGVTAEFNRNVLHVINRELAGNFDPTRFEHVARFDPDEEWIEMHLRSRCSQDVRISDLALDVRLAEGELVRTEISAKFRRERITAEFERAGFRLIDWWTDTAADFAVALTAPA